MNIKTHPTLWVCGVFSVQTTPKELMQYTCSMFMRGRCKLSSVFVFVFVFVFVTASIFVHKHVNCSTQCSSVLVIKCQLMVAVHNCAGCAAPTASNWRRVQAGGQDEDEAWRLHCFGNDVEVWLVDTLPPQRIRPDEEDELVSVKLQSSWLPSN